MIDINICDRAVNKHCKSREEIDKFLENFFMTFNIMIGNVQLYNPSNPYGNPLRMVDNFHS